MKAQTKNYSKQTTRKKSFIYNHQQLCILTKSRCYTFSHLLWLEDGDNYLSSGKTVSETRLHSCTKHLKIHSCLLHHFQATMSLELKIATLQKPGISITEYAIKQYCQVKYHSSKASCASLLILCVHAKLLQLCLTLCDPIGYSPPASSVHGVLQARILEWVTMLSSRGSPGIEPETLMFPALAGGFFTTSATWKALTDFTSHYFCRYYNICTYLGQKYINILSNMLIL